MISKFFTRRWPVKLSSRRADLQRAIEELRTPKEEQKKRREVRAQAEQHGGHIEDGPVVEVPMEEDGVPLESIDLTKAGQLNGQSSESGAPSTHDRDYN